MAAIKTILVPLDGSKAAEAALARAVEVAHVFDGRIVLVNARSRPELGVEFEASPEIHDEVLQRIIEQSTDYLDAVAATLHESGIKIETISNEGHAADVILNAVAASHADLIVMTPHGHGGIKRWLLGGTTDKLIHRSTVPILLVRDTLTSQANPAETHTKQHAFFVHSF